MTYRTLSGVKPGPLWHAASPAAAGSIESLSAQAYEVLQQAGYARIKNLKGGIMV